MKVVSNALALEKKPRSLIRRRTAVFSMCLVSSLVTIGQAQVSGAEKTQSQKADSNQEVTKKEPRALSVMGVRLGMTGKEVVAILKSQGMLIRHISRSDSATVRLAKKFGQPNPQLKYVTRILASPRTGSPFVNVQFCEDLPNRPGVGIVYRLTYRKKLSRNAQLQPKESYRQFRAALVKRFGEPSGDGLVWKRNAGTSNVSRLIATCGSIFYIEMKSSSLCKRSSDGERLLEQKMLKKLPKPKLELDF